MTFTRKIFASLIVLTAVAAIYPLLAFGIGTPEHRDFVHGTVAVDVTQADNLFAGQVLGLDQPITASVRLTNTGSLPVNFALTATSGMGRQLSPALHVAVYRKKHRIHEGSLAELDHIRLGTLAPGKSAKLTIEISVTPELAASLVGGDAPVDFAWDAAARV